VYIDTGSSVLYIPSKSCDLMDENNKMMEWKWFETTVLFQLTNWWWVESIDFSTYHSCFTWNNYICYCSWFETHGWSHYNFSTLHPLFTWNNYIYCCWLFETQGWSRSDTFHSSRGFRTMNNSKCNCFKWNKSGKWKN
jgi:hypothetical protein